MRVKPRKLKPTSSRESKGTEEIDYVEDMKIDPDFLDAEFLRHPELAMKYGMLSAQANKEAKEAEERVKTLRSELVKNANEDPERYLGKGIKATAPVVEAFYRNDEDYKEAKQEWIDAVYNADLLSQATYAIQARKTVLENLVRLVGLEYNSTPLEPRDLPEMAEQLEQMKKKQTQNRIKNRLNERQ